MDFPGSPSCLQEDIDSRVQNGIKANTEKTKVMVFGSKCGLVKVPPFEIKFGDVILQKVSSYKYLGITLDPQLSYNIHVNKVIHLVSSKLKQFQRMRSFLNTKAAMMVYKGMILPILEYGDVFFSATSTENRRRLQVLQNKGLRCALNKDLEVSSEDLHREAHLLKLRFRREQHTLNFTYDTAQIAANCKAISELSVKTRSSNKLTLKTKCPRTEKFKRSLAYIGPFRWNALPESIYKSLVSNWISCPKHCQYMRDM